MKLFLYISRNLPNASLSKHICTKDKATKKQAVLFENEIYLTIRT